jgi:hypothetical protein
MTSTSIWWNWVEAKRPTGVKNLELAGPTGPRRAVRLEHLEEVHNRFADTYLSEAVHLSDSLAVVLQRS